MEQQFMIWVASLGGKSAFFDTFAILFVSNDLLKGAPFAMALLLAWQVPFEKNDQTHKIHALRMFLVVILSVVIARVSQRFFYSPRPIMVKEIADHFSGFAKSFRLDWNSFPSDHMCLYFPIALMTYFKNKKLGLALIAWSILVVGLPRIYIGRHYPSDVLGGMIAGALTIAAVWPMRPKLDPVLERISAIFDQYPKTAAGLIFIFCFEVATVFDGARWIAESIKSLIH